MIKKATALHLIGQLCLGLGLGTGWLHDATPYPGVLGFGLLTAGAFSILVALVQQRVTLKKPD